MNFSKTPTTIPDLYVIKAMSFADTRGKFIESYNQKDFEELGITTKFVQSNQSYSRQGVLRGLHLQREKPQAKLVRVVSGAIFDVAVDLRYDHPGTWGKWFGIELNDYLDNMLYIPEGFAHGFLALTNSIIEYKCSEFYYPEFETGVRWNDPNINIRWPLVKDPIMSEKDKKLPFHTYLFRE